MQGISAFTTYTYCQTLLSWWASDKAVQCFRRYRHRPIHAMLPVFPGNNQHVVVRGPSGHTGVDGVVVIIPNTLHINTLHINTLHINTLHINTLHNNTSRSNDSLHRPRIASAKDQIRDITHTSNSPTSQMKFDRLQGGTAMTSLLTVASVNAIYTLLVILAAILLAGSDDHTAATPSSGGDASFKQFNTGTPYTYNHIEIIQNQYQYYEVCFGLLGMPLRLHDYSLCCHHDGYPSSHESVTVHETISSVQFDPDARAPFIATIPDIYSISSAVGNQTSIVITRQEGQLIVRRSPEQPIYVPYHIEPIVLCGERLSELFVRETPVPADQGQKTQRIRSRRYKRHDIPLESPLSFTSKHPRHHLNMEIRTPLRLRATRLILPRRACNMPHYPMSQMRTIN